MACSLPWHDRGASKWKNFDGRGRAARGFNRVVKPGSVEDWASAEWDARYAKAATTNELHDGDWFQVAFAFDAADRQVSSTTGATVADLLGQGGETRVETQYTARGTVKTVAGSYGALVNKIVRTADGLLTDIEYGDIARTTTSFNYDLRRRLSSVQTYRGPAELWSDPNAYSPGPAPNGSPSSFQILLQDEEFTYDVVNNPVEIRDWRIADEWPVGAKPVTKKVQYDDLYRVSRVEHLYAGGDDNWVSPHLPDIDVDADNDDPRRAAPAPHVSFEKRIQHQTYEYDWLGNTANTGDDAGGFYDRSPRCD